MHILREPALNLSAVSYDSIETFMNDYYLNVFFSRK